MQEAEVKLLFNKLKIRTLLDLALILPTSYEDTRLSFNFEAEKIQTFEAIVLDRDIRGSKMRVYFELPTLKSKILGFFFKATPYHKRLFSIGSHHIIHGKVTIFNGLFQILQPRSLKSYGKLIPKYKTSIKTSEMEALISIYITEQNLYSEGLNNQEVNLILTYHYPKDDTLVLPPDTKELKILKSIEAFNHLKKLRSKRKTFPAIKALKKPIEPFLNSLPFELTNDQKLAIEDIRKDLARSDRACRRMVIGDVGSGKTMVILASAFIASRNRSILMAPTSILAHQLYDEACKYLPKELKIVLIIQGNKDRDYTQADFIIGTHALLYIDDLPRASLVMVDEQHRFGTSQRAKLKELISQEDKRPHYLQFSATPIPRTQAMIESELIDISLITQMPFKKMIHSKTISKSDFSMLINHIKSEIKKEHQVVIVYPLVEESSEIPYQSIEEAKGFWEKNFNDVYVTYGKDKNKEQILFEFREKGKILLATTVIEVGISLPRLSTIVIVGAERLGLATLHQLRGRVGRNGLESWCFLYSNKRDNGRLEKFCKIQSGFDIARLDLEYRDSGDILDGTTQSGQKFKWLDLAKDEDIIKAVKVRIEKLNLSSK